MSAEETGTTEKGFPLGPVQVLVVGFGEDAEFKGEALKELQSLKERDIVRLIDLLVVKKDQSGDVAIVQLSDLSDDEAMEFGAIVGALMGFAAGGDEEEVEQAAAAGAAALEDGHAIDDSAAWYLADAVPPGMTAAIALLEHRWALPLRDKILDAGGVLLADEWIHPMDLVAAGVLAREEAKSGTS